MTPDAIRIAMAKADGWIDPVSDHGVPPNTPVEKQDGCPRQTLPKYNTLDDCQRVFRGLTREQKVTAVASVYLALQGDGELPQPFQFEATPAQWCEAILKATSRWVES